MVFPTFLFITSYAMLVSQFFGSNLRLQTKNIMRKSLLLTLGLISFLSSQVNAQTYIWAEQFTGSSYQMPQDLEADVNGATYSCGWMIGTSTFDTISLSGISYDGFVVKYNKDGHALWAQRLGGTSYDGAFQVARDGTDGVYVAGWFYGNFAVADTTLTGTATDYDAFLVKFDTNGVFQWVKTQTGSGYTKPIGLEADDDGDVYVQIGFTGNFTAGSSSLTATTTSTSFCNNALIKYDTDGNYQWKTQIEGDHYIINSWYWDYAGGVAIDGSGNPYCTGTFNVSDTLEVGSLTLFSTAAYDAYLVKFNQANGNASWARKGGGSSYEYGTSVQIDNNDKIFISGYNYSTNSVFGSVSLTTAGPYFMRYNTSGSAIAGQSGGGLAYMNRISLDNEGNLYMSGLMAANNNISMGGLSVTNPSGSSYTPYFYKYDYANSDAEYLIAPTSSSNIEYECAISAYSEDYVFANGSFYGTTAFGSTSLISTSYDGFLTRIANCDQLVAVASSSAGNAVCSGEITQLQADTNSLYSYQWLYNGAVLSGEINSTYTTGNAGNYSVIVDSIGCKDTSNVIALTINSLPTVTHSALASVCNGDDPFILSGGTPSGGTYSGSAVTGGNTFNPGSAAIGNNYVTYIYTNANGCTDSVTKTINVQSSPAIFTTTISACASDGPISLASSSYGYPTGGSHSGTGVSGTNFSPTAAGAGTHIIYYTSSSGCVSPDSITATVNAAPSVSLGSFTNKCVSASGFLLTGGSPSGGTYSGLGVFGAYYYPSFAGTGTHNVIYTVTASGCSASDTSTITVVPAASSSISTFPALCEDADTLHLASYGTPSGGTFSGTGVSSNIFNPGTSGSGSFTITYTYTNACGTATDTETMTVNDLPTVSITPTHVSCNGGSNGSATAAGSGTASPYSYAWSSGASVATATGLTAGTYTVTVTDNNGCEETGTVTITQPTALSVSATANATSCNGGSNGLASAFASGGTTSYTYSWSSGAASSIATGLTAGTYTITVTDANSCTATATATVTQPTAVVASISGTNIGCNGATNGSATASATGGTGTKSFVWSTGATTASVSGLSAGTYTVTASDANSCTDTETVTITQPAALVASIGTTTNVSCFGGSNGSATASATGGTGTKTYAWSGGGGSSATASSLTAGTYTVTVTDANGCTDTETTTITQPATGVTTSVGTPTNVSCNGGSNGSATASATGGTGTKTFVWSSGSTSASATGLTAGTYTVTATDANGCTDTETVSITQPSALIASTTVTNNVTCNGASSGAASASATGGTTAYTYVWSTGATTSAVTGLAAGTFTVTVTDANGCTDTETVTITQPTVLTAAIGTPTNVSCNGASDGSATASASGGTTAYTYAWSNGGTAAINSGLAAGTYTVTITDANGCTDTETTTITQPTALVASIGTPTNVSCFGGANGSATASATGGTGTKTYAWSGGGGSSATASSLTAGTYTVTVTDANGCTDTESTTITQPSTGVTASIGTPNNVSCNGGSNGSATASASGGTGTITFAWSTGATTASVTSLSAGTYTVTATDANGCTDTETVTITQPTAITIPTLTRVNVSCNGGNNGTLTAVPSGGTAAYTYAWTTGATTATATGLTAGSYTVTVTDANGCTQTKVRAVTQPTAVVASISGNNVSCNGGSSGSATASASGGTGTKSFVWSTGATTASVTGLTAGTYTVTASDANSCTDTETVTITEPTAVVASIGTPTNVSCNGGSDGSATASASGGTTAYTYAWSSGATTAAATGLTAGSYTVTVTDANGCTDTETTTITQPATAVTAIIGTPNNVSCNGASDGSATASGTGGTGTITFAWSTGATSASVTGLSAGTYTVTATDANSCTDTETVTITQPSALIASIVADSNVSCNGASDGGATASATGGTTAYTYAWSNGATTSSITGIIAGTYTVTITDANGCTDSESVTITEPSAMTASIGTPTNASCNGASDGSATASVSGGTATFTYAWSNGGTSATNSGLAAGTYTVTVTDANGCSDTESVTITEPTAVVASIGTPTNVSCNGGSDGSATASASGGTTAYTYAWSSGATTAAATGLTAGSYTVTVTDANGCTDTETTTITQPATAVTAIIGTPNNVSCNGASDGSATASGTGGTGTITFAWSTGATSASVTGLSAGTYTVTATDANSCTDTETVTITQPSALIASIVADSNVSCNGASDGGATASATGGTTTYTYSWSNAATTASITGVIAGTYSVTITDANGCTDSASVTITEPASVIASAVLDNNASCNGASDGGATASATGGTTAYTYSWSNAATTATVTGLAVGTYSVTITDANGCTDSASVTITEPASVIASAVVDNNASCNGGADGGATASATGGTTSYTYTWSNAATTASITGVIAGTYSVTITDANGCTDSASVTITEPTQLVTSSVVDSNTTCNGTADGGATASATGGTGTYTYTWSNAATTASITGVNAGTYSVTITDANGCTDSSSVTITEPASLIASGVVDNNASCNGASDGGATASATGGTTTYTYSWSNAATTASITGVIAGTYSVTITDANGCTDSASVTITEPASLVATGVVNNHVSCNSGSNGSATASATGGTTAYTYSWSNAATTATVTGLAAGTYSVTITDANGCTDSSSVTIAEPTMLVVSASVDSNSSCSSTANGVASASASGGITPYTYAWSSGASTAIATGLANGQHVVTITDANGCSDTASVNILVLDTVLPTVIAHNITRYLGNNGMDTITAAMVDSASYDNCAIDSMWVDQISFDCADLGANLVTLYVLDVNGNLDSANATITVVDTTGPQALAISSIYVWLDGSGNASISAASVDSSSYDNCSVDSMWLSDSLFDCTDSVAYISLYVKDGSGNVSTANLTTVVVNDSISPTVISQNITAYLDASGEAIISASQLDGGSFDNCAVVSLWTWDTLFTCDSVGVRSVPLYASDAWGNTSIAFASVTVLDTLAPVILAQNLTVYLNNDGWATIDTSLINTGTFDNCSIDSMWLSDSIFDCADVGTVSIQFYASDLSGNVSNETVSITVVDSIAPTIVASNQIGYLDANGTFSLDVYQVGLGSYDSCGLDSMWLSQSEFGCTDIGLNYISISAIDINGNQRTTGLSVTILDTLTTVVVYIDSAILCHGLNNGQLTANASGMSSTYNYSWSNSSTSSTINGLGANTYIVTATDVNGCSAVDSATLIEPDALIGSLSAMDISCYGLANGYAATSVSGGTSAYSYVWNTSATTDSIGGLLAGIYTVTISDVNDCQLVLDTTIVEPDSLVVTVILSDTSLCFGDTSAFAIATVNGGTSQYAFDWIGTGVTNDTLSNIGAGTYILLVTDGSGCVASDTQTITSDTLPIVTLSLPIDSTCQFVSVELTGQTPIGGVFSGAGVVADTLFTDTLTGWNTVYYTFSDANGCAGSAMDSVFVTPSPNISFTSLPIEICGGTSIPLDFAMPFGGVYSGDAYIIDTTNNLLVGPDTGYAGIGVYTYSNECGADTQSFNILVHATPIVDLGDDVTLCNASTIVFNAGVHNSYNWFDGTNGSTLTLNDGEVPLTEDVIVWVEVSDSMGCLGSDSVYVTVDDQPIFYLGNNIVACLKDVVTLTVDSVYDNFVWSTGDTSLSIIAHDGSMMTPGNYPFWVTGSNEAGGCSYTDTIYVQLNDCDSSFVGIEQVESLVNIAFEVYPNPTQNNFNVRGADGTNADISRIVIQGMRGDISKVFRMADFNYTNGEIQLDVQDLANGVYLMSIEHQYGINTVRVIVGK